MEDVEGRDIKQTVTGGRWTKWSQVRRNCGMLGKGDACQDQMADRG